MEDILYSNSWMDYHDNFHLEFNIIDFPKNVYFTANVLSEYLKKNADTYRKYPYAEKFNISTLNNVEWQNSVITFNKHGKIILAPEPVIQLINLSKRINYQRAEREIFGGFTIPFIEIKFYSIVVVITIIICIIKCCIYFDLVYRFKFL